MDTIKSIVVKIKCIYFILTRKKIALISYSPRKKAANFNSANFSNKNLRKIIFDVWSKLAAEDSTDFTPPTDEQLAEMDKALNGGDYNGFLKDAPWETLNKVEK